MKTKKAALVYAAVTLCEAAAFVSSAPRSTGPGANLKGFHYIPIVTPLDRFQGYRKWAKVNPRPFNMDVVTATLCAAPVQPRPEESAASPHVHKYLTVYVNAIGQKAMHAVKPAFPVGSIIIKEKLKSHDSKTPELLTAMVKHPSGYDSKNGDWEYVALNGTATKIDGQGKLANCQSCHAAQKGTDFVFRSYLTMRH